ncbi:MAG: hypothetical protein AAGG09_06335 [Pseudomonadota bacterium]
MTSHEYPLAPERPAADGAHTSGRHQRRAAQYWNELRLDWLHTRMDAPCSSN